MESAIIQAYGIGKSYQIAGEEIEILSRISFEVHKGSMIALQGPSGSGKTSLLNMLALITKPSSGSLKFDNFEVNNKSQQQELDVYRTPLIGYIFQQFNLLGQFNALQNVCLPMVPVKKTFDVQQRAKMLLDQVGMSHRLRHTPARLSGGEQQRVAIARALIHSPEILLCDEPTGNLDTKSRDSIMELIGELRSGGMTVIIATHDESVAEQCDTIWKLRDGCLISS